jgi:hypothetical protein
VCEKGICHGGHLVGPEPKVFSSSSAWTRRPQDRIPLTIMRVRASAST